MNRLLIVVIIVLMPITIVTCKKNEELVSNNDNFDIVRLEVPLENDYENSNQNEEVRQVLVSSEVNKSNPFYLDLEEYVVGVVAGEMPASFDMEALKAQAVAARTYALYKMKIENYVLSTNINDQVYLTIDEMKNMWKDDFSHYYERVVSAVSETEGEVVTYNNEIISAYYFAISNGYTDNASAIFGEEKAYLVSVDSNWDKNFKSISSTRTMDKISFCSKLNISCNNIVIENVVRASNNYVREITINGVAFSGKDIFNKLSLKSTDFEIIINLDNVQIITKGFGHGVGMSQYGAQGMARLGYDYREILKHYYQNTNLTKLAV